MSSNLDTFALNSHSMLITFTLTFDPYGSIGKKPALVQAIIWANDGLIYWYIDALFGLNNLIDE